MCKSLCFHFWVPEGIVFGNLRAGSNQLVEGNSIVYTHSKSYDDQTIINKRLSPKRQEKSSSQPYALHASPEPA